MGISRDIAAWEDATNTKQGPMELATQAEVDAGGDSLRGITPLELSSAVSVVEKFVAYKTANDSVTSSTTLVDDTHLTFTGLAAGEYAVTCLLLFTADVGADILVALVNTEGDWIFKSNVNNNAFRDNNSVTGVKLNAATGLSFSGGYLRGKATVPASGEITLQFAQAVSDSIATTLRTGSWMIIEKLA